MLSVRFPISGSDRIGEEITQNLILTIPRQINGHDAYLLPPPFLSLYGARPAAYVMARRRHC
jgi:hypothetical protein